MPLASSVAESLPEPSTAEPARPAPTQPASQEPSQLPSQQAAPSTLQDGDAYRPDELADFTVYLYADRENVQALHGLFYPIKWPVGETLDGAGLFDLLQTYSAPLKAQAEYAGATLELSVYEGIAQVNLVGFSPLYHTEHTIGETLLRGSEEVHTVQIFEDGVPLKSETVDAQGIYLPLEDFRLPFQTPEALAQLRASTPHQLDLTTPDESMLLTYAEGPEWKELTEFLYAVHYNNGHPVFATVQEAPAEFILLAALENTAWSRYDNESEQGAQISGKAKEHVEQTALLLFEADASADPSAVSFIWEYNPYTRMYGHTATGLYGYNTPVILEYSTAGSVYNITVVFLTADINNDWIDADRNPLAENDLEAYCKTQAQQYSIRLEKQPDGSYRYLSCMELQN